MQAQNFHIPTKCILNVKEDSEDIEEKDVEGMIKVLSVCGWYALDSSGKYCEDKRYVKYLHMPTDLKVNFDLTKSHANDIYKPQEKMSESIDDLLMWTTKHSVDEQGNPKIPGVDFISFRGLLTRIMWTPYERQDSLMLCAIRLRGTTYLCQFATEENKENMAKMNTEEMKIFTRYGYKFEQYMLTDKPNEAPNADEPLSELEEMCCLFQTQIGDHQLMYGAEIDGLPNEEALLDLSSASLVELKTCKENPSEYSFTRFKLLKWWAQSYLANVDTVVVGYRDDKGTVNKLEKIQVDDMPTQAKRRWEPKHCIRFINDFLNFVKYTMKDAPDNDPTAVYQFKWSPKKDIVNFVGTQLPANNQCKFIPQWYIDWLNSIPY